MFSPLCSYRVECGLHGDMRDNGFWTVPRSVTVVTWRTGGTRRCRGSPDSPASLRREGFYNRASKRIAWSKRTISGRSSVHQSDALPWLLSSQLARTPSQPFKRPDAALCQTSPLAAPLAPSTGNLTLTAPLPVCPETIGSCAFLRFLGWFLFLRTCSSLGSPSSLSAGSVDAEQSPPSVSIDSRGEFRVSRNRAPGWDGMEELSRGGLHV